MTIAMNLEQAAMATAGRLIGVESVAAVFQGVSTDSRHVVAGELFVALHGENFDGHVFVAAARDRGAVAALVAEDRLKELAPLTAAGWPLIAVADPRLALGALASAWRAKFTLPLIAVTGSNGKTTTKEMIASILKTAFGDRVLATQGNLNNDIGLPLTLLRLDETHRAAIVEMGMNRPGEIACLTRIARPGIAVVTNAQRAHLAGMGSVEAIANEKGDIYDGLPAGGVAVINADDEWASLWQQQNAVRPTLTFGLQHKAGVSGLCQVHGLENRLQISWQGEHCTVDLALPGVHNARNALAAAAAALAAGISLADVAAGLAAFRGIKGRLQRRLAMNGATLLDDSYNANPDSMRAGIDVLAATIGQKILVLGDMGEIGEMTAQFHDEVGGYAKSQGIDRLFTLGESSQLAARNFGTGGEHFRKPEALVEALLPVLTPETTILVKGSRFMRMERVVNAILADDAMSAVSGEKPACC